jgi:hypothetical protein
VLLDIQDVSVQEPLIEAVVSVLAAPGLSELLQADRPASAGGNSKGVSSDYTVSSGSSNGGSVGGGSFFRQQFMQSALVSATKLIGVSGLEPVLLRHVAALVSCSAVAGPRSFQMYTVACFGADLLCRCMR